eukprot:scaffold305_cov110-Cylindrotheca_fusiformis.AAC.18
MSRSWNQQDLGQENMTRTTTESSSLSASFESLWEAIEETRERIAKGKSPVAEPPAFLQLLNEEVHRVTRSLEHEEKLQERFAKSLLCEIEGKADSPSYFRAQAKEIMNSSLKLRNCVDKIKAALESIAASADETMDTECTEILAKKMSVHPWNAASSTLAVVLSDIFEGIRLLGASDKRASEGKWEAPSSFERSTTKYWVESSKLTDLLYACVQEVPLLVYGKSGRLTTAKDLESLENDKLWMELSTKISSVYFDSPSMSLYKDRIARKEGAQLLRARWYGRKPTGDEEVFLELKTHHEKWIGATSVKERVTVMEKHMTAFLQRVKWNYSDAQSIVSEANPKMKKEELSKAASLLLRMHELVVQKDLVPCVRSVYSRAAFQASDSNALRLTLDKDVTMIDERSAPQGAWCLPEGTRIRSSMKKRVPFPVFEVKLAGSEMPGSLETLVSNGVIIEAAKFSKFLTGAAAYNSDKIKVLPYWAENPAFNGVFLPTRRSNSIHKQSYASSSPNSNVISTSSAPIVASATTGSEVPMESTCPSRHNQGLFQRFLDCFRSNKQHRIAPQKPARVEPKSYFANERTFIQWSSSALWLLTVAGLIAERESEDGVSYLTNTGIALCVGSIMLLIHAIVMYFRRIKLMQTGNPNGYVDKVGPIVLTAAVFLGVVVLLAEKSKSVVTNSNQGAGGLLRYEEGRCVLRSNEGVSALLYEPSDFAVDDEHDLLLTVSLTQVFGHSKKDPTAAIRQLIDIKGADLEGLAIAEGRIFALSEPDDASSVPMLFELAWQEDGGLLRVAQQFHLESNGGESSEGIAYVPGNTEHGGGGSLYIDKGLGKLNLYDLPPPVAHQQNDKEADDSESTTSSSMVRKAGLNKRLITNGLLDGKVGALYFFEGVMYILHDNDRVLRAWDLSTGSLLSEISLPGVLEGQHQWEGIAIERNEAEASGLRGSNDASSLTVHMTLDTPPEVWSFSVREGGQTGELIFPECAGVN